MDTRRVRTVQEVFDDHLQKRKSGSLQADITRNYSEDVCLLSADGLARGHDAIRDTARKLAEEVPEAVIEYVTRLVDGEMAFVEWRARSEIARIDDGADSFLIRDGKIVAQTIHYTVQERR